VYKDLTRYTGKRIYATGFFFFFLVEGGGRIRMKRGGGGVYIKRDGGLKKKISDLKIRSGLIFFSSRGLYREKGGGGNDQVDFFILI
jgi:hypothetical protein